VIEQQEHIKDIIKVEEERFNETVNDGLARLTEIINFLEKEGKTIVSGEDVFKLYDTYGFPNELTEEYVKDYGLTIDQNGFEEEMEKQRERARAARENVGSMQVQNAVLT